MRKRALSKLEHWNEQLRSTASVSCENEVAALELLVQCNDQNLRDQQKRIEEQRRIQQEEERRLKEEVETNKRAEEESRRYAEEVRQQNERRLKEMDRRKAEEIQKEQDRRKEEERRKEEQRKQEETLKQEERKRKAEEDKRRIHDRQKAETTRIAMSNDANALDAGTAVAYVAQAYELVQAVAQIEVNDVNYVKICPELKGARMSLTLAIKRQLNCASNTQTQVQTVLQSLCVALGPLVTHPDPRVKNYGVYELANRVLLETERGGTLYQNESSVWSFAWLISGLWTNVPKFREVFLGSLFRYCSYAVPYWPQHRKGTSTQGLKKIQGRSQNEKDEVFHNRMARLVRLYLGILIVRQEREQLWLWFARFTNISATTASLLTPTILASSIEVAGYDALQYFGSQFRKVLIYCEKILLPKLFILKETDPVLLEGPYCKLETSLLTFKSQGRLETSEGRDMKHNSQPPNPAA